MGHIHWIGIDGTRTDESRDEGPTLKQVQEFVGGYVERHVIKYNDKNCPMYVNEEANLFEPPLPVNEEGTRIYHEHYRDVVGLALTPERLPPIRGPVVLLEEIDLKEV